MFKSNLKKILFYVVVFFFFVFFLLSRLSKTHLDNIWICKIGFLLTGLTDKIGAYLVLGPYIQILNKIKIKPLLVNGFKRLDYYYYYFLNKHSLLIITNYLNFIQAQTRGSLSIHL